MTRLRPSSRCRRWQKESPSFSRATLPAKSPRKPDMHRRVAITGVGVICAIGCNRDEFWDSLSNGRPGIRPIQSIPAGQLRFPNGAEVQDYQPAQQFEEKDLSLLDRFAQFGTIAAREAVKD